MDRLSTLSAMQRRILIIVFGLVSLVVVTDFIYHVATAYMIDPEVSQDTGWALRRDQDLCSPEFPIRSGFRFTCPPFTVLLSHPLTWAEPVILQIIWMLATLAMVWAVLWMASTRLGSERPKLMVICVPGVVMLLDPLHASVFFRQISVFLALLVVPDVLGFLPKELREPGVGIAAGIKVIPTAYTLVLLMRRGFAVVAKSFCWFPVTVAIGFAMYFKELTHFWIDEFSTGSHDDVPAYEANQASNGLLTHIGIEGTMPDIGIYDSFLIGAVAVTFVAWVYHRNGYDVAALGLVALAVSFARPYAISHHWSIAMISMPLVLFVRKIGCIIISALLMIASWWVPYKVFIGNGFGHAASMGQWFYSNMQGVIGSALFFTYPGYVIHLCCNLGRARS